MNQTVETKNVLDCFPHRFLYFSLSVDLGPSKKSIVVSPGFATRSIGVASDSFHIADSRVTQRGSVNRAFINELYSYETRPRRGLLLLLAVETFRFSARSSRVERKGRRDVPFRREGLHLSLSLSLSVARVGEIGRSRYIMPLA